MILESGMAFLKSLPPWLHAVTEVLIVTVVFMTAVTFLAGVWVGLRIIGLRMKNIKELQFIPPKIVFEHDDNQDK